MDSFGKFDLARSEVTVRINRQLICQDQQTIQRSSQFVAHIGQKFALEPAGRSQLLCFLFKGLSSLFDFAILTFDLRVLFYQLGRLFLEFEIGFLQFELTTLQFVGQRLRLLEQIFGQRVRFDRV